MRPPFDTERELRRHGKALHRLAQALLRDGADADDVTQEVWLAALQSPPPQQSSPGGWLQTVVRRLAGRLRRSRSRRVAREAAAAKQEAVAAADEVAAKSELLHRVVDAVQGLEEPYRATVWQRYFEELPPSVISQRSGVPVATVKSRLQRGLALLRERLDCDGEGGEWRAGLAAAFGIGSGVRVAAAAAAGVLLMGTAAKLALGGGVVAAAAAVLWWTTADPLPRILPLAEDPTLAPIAATGSVEAEAKPVERTEAIVDADGPVLPPTTLRGRCVDEDGAPLARCTIELNGRGMTSTFDSANSWRAPEPVLTGADGRFEFAVRPPAGIVVLLDAHCDGRSRRIASWGGLEPRQVVDAGDLVLPGGFVVTGTVVEENGAPLARGQVRLETLPKVWPVGRGNDSAGGRVGADGRFTMSAVPAGVWSLSADCQGYELVSPDRVVVDLQHGAAPVRVVMRAVPKLEGIVIDERGAPVAWVALDGHQEDGQAVASGMSGRNGRFFFYAKNADAQPIRIEPSTTGMVGTRLCELLRPDRSLHAWGSSDVRIVVRRPLRVPLVVVERGSGTPVTRYAVKCFPDRLNNSNHNFCDFGEHPGGKLELTNVWPGGNSLVVVPEDLALVPSARIAFAASDAGTAPLRVELERMRPATVRVTTADGTPFADVKVEILAPGTATLKLDQHVFDPRANPLQAHTNLDYRFPEPRSEAMTDADGRAAVLVSDGSETLAVRALDGATHLVLVQPAHLVPGQQFDAVVPKAASIVGTVQLRGFEPGRVLLACWRVGDKPPHRDEGVQLQKDGSFEVRGLPAGSFQLQLRHRVMFGDIGSSEVDPVALGVAIPEVELESGEQRRVEIDATTLAAASVRGRALLDGAVPKGARMFLRAGDGTRYGRYRVDDEGRFTATALPPGSYRVGLLFGEGGDAAQILPAEAFVLASGQELARDFAFTRTRLLVRLVTADGSPAAGVVCMFENDGFSRKCTTDGDGYVRLDPAPDGSVRLCAVREGGVTQLGEVGVPAGRLEHAVTLTLPAAK